MPATSNNTPAVLVVDDEKVVRVMIRRQLEAEGFAVYDAGGGREAIQLILDRGATIGLLITDVLMPFMNGRELATRISVIRPDLKVLFISAYSADILSGLGLGPKGVDFLRKPFRHGELAQRVRRLLAAGPTWRQLVQVA